MSSGLGSSDFSHQLRRRAQWSLVSVSLKQRLATYLKKNHSQAWIASGDLQHARLSSHELNQNQFGGYKQLQELPQAIDVI